MIPKILNYFEELGGVYIVLSFRKNCSIVSIAEWPDQRSSVRLSFWSQRHQQQQQTTQANAAATTPPADDNQQHLAPTTHAVAEVTG